MGSDGKLVLGGLLDADDEIEAVDVIEIPEHDFASLVEDGGPGVNVFWYGLAGPYDPSDAPPPVGRARRSLAALVGRVAEWVEAVAEKLDEWRWRIDPNSGPLW